METLLKLWRCLFSWRAEYPTWEKLDEIVRVAQQDGKDVVITTQDFGMCAGNKPGIGNHLMADSLRRVVDKHSELPVLAQLAVARAAAKRGIVVDKVIGPPETDTPLDRSTVEYNTLTVARSQKEWLTQKGMFPAVALTLTSPFHMRRVQWTMEHEGFIVVPIPLPSTSQKAYCDPTSLYRSIRIAAKVPGGVALLYLREVFARLLFLKKNWM